MLFGEQYRSLWNELEAERDHTKALEAEVERLKTDIKNRRLDSQALRRDIRILARKLKGLKDPEREELLNRIAELEIRVKVLENENAKLEQQASRGYVSFPRPSFSAAVESRMEAEEAETEGEAEVSRNKQE
ncbi:hypothetical protein TWF730_007348 [Orbilia blumenaviensis]|uniref:Uncharacterized protein n=1 Tax=Orbilia blumenaviensis TaxID=1796055 RepID=A0AAV9V9U5_9PEZI